MNVGVLGSGFIVNEFVKETTKYKFYHLIGIWGRHEEKLINFKDYFEYYTTDLNKLLNDPKIDTIYVALPTGLHYEYALKALKAKKNVIVEKSFTVTCSEAKELFDYANKHNLICIEAITTRYNPNYKKLKKYVSELGEIKMIDGNLSQYSRRYDKFKQGIILPVFDKKLAGGSLLDLNVYNIHFVTGIFGKPLKVEYYPNMVKGVDASGVVIMVYKNFIARLIAGKDNTGKCHIDIQGDEGYLRVNSTTSRCANIEVKLNNGKSTFIPGEDTEFVGYEAEIKEFIKIFKNKDKKLLKEYEKDTLLTQKVLEDALISANIKY